MDEFFSDGYSEPCAQCAAVDWGVTDEGQFFCKNCHNVIERTREVFDHSTLQLTNNRISRIAKTKKTTKEGAREWMVCEGFQFILKHQADALVSLGVCSEFKTEVMWNFWKRYLQITKQAFTNNPISTERFSVNATSESEPESVYSVVSTKTGDSMVSDISSDERFSVCSGSTDASSYVNRKERKSRNLMTMPRTLAMCYLGLLWVREAITLADLLRLVTEKRVPYLNVHEIFPEELSVYGRDTSIFRVESIPSYAKVQSEAVNLAQVMKLPTFPAITQDCLLHPIPLTVRYLLETNLPDGLHVWVQRVIEEAALGDDSFLTFNPVKKKPILLYYDIQAVALIIVTLKLLFKLDDQVKWASKRAAADKKKKKVFSFVSWYEIMQPAFERAKRKREGEEALRQWKSTKPFIASLKNKSIILKNRRVVEFLEQRFQMLSNSKQQSSTTTPFSTFQFHWGNDEGSDGPSMHDHQLDCTIEKRGVQQLSNQKYWHPVLAFCSPKTKHHFAKIEQSFPRMYVWLLDLFSFVLGVGQAQVHEEVVFVERCFLKGKYQHDTDTDFQPPCKKLK